MARPPPRAPPTATSTGRSSRHGHTPRCALRCVRGRAGWCRTGGGGPATPRERVAVVANGRVAVTSPLILGPERNQGWRGARRGHADDVAAWFVSIGRLSPVPPVVECDRECRVDCRHAVSIDATCRLIQFQTLQTTVTAQQKVEIPSIISVLDDLENHLGSRRRLDRRETREGDTTAAVPPT